MADDKSVILLDEWASAYGMRVRIALLLKGIEYENREEYLPNKSPLLLQMNPIHKKIPVLIHNGKPVCESLIILHYIEEAWPQSPPLLPSDPYERARARFLADLIDKKVNEVGIKLWREQTREAKEAATKELMEGLKLLEEELGDKHFFGGDEMGYVDVAFSFFASWFYLYEKYGNFKMEEEQPKLMEWVNRCMKEPRFSKTMPDPNKLYEFLDDYIKKMLGIK